MSFKKLSFSKTAELSTEFLSLGYFTVKSFNSTLGLDLGKSMNRLPRVLIS